MAEVTGIGLRAGGLGDQQERCRKSASQIELGHGALTLC